MCHNHVTPIKQGSYADAGTAFYSSNRSET
jgi:hypothetical protein